MNIKTELTVDKSMFELLEIVIDDHWKDIQTHLLLSDDFLIGFDKYWYVIHGGFFYSLVNHRWTDRYSSLVFTDRTTLRLTMNAS